MVEVGRTIVVVKQIPCHKPSIPKAYMCIRMSYFLNSTKISKDINKFMNLIIHYYLMRVLEIHYKGVLEIHLLVHSFNYTLPIIKNRSFWWRKNLSNDHRIVWKLFRCPCWDGRDHQYSQQWLCFLVGHLYFQLHISFTCRCYPIANYAFIDL